MIDPRPGSGDFSPKEKENPPLDISNSWICDWDIWLAKKLKALIEKVKK
jgi:hypothetical protein